MAAGEPQPCLRGTQMQQNPAGGSSWQQQAVEVATAIKERDNVAAGGYEDLVEPEPEAEVEPEPEPDSS